MNKVVDTEGAVDGLTPGHGDGVVVQDAIGDIDARGDRCPNGQYARVEVGAVAEVLEHVLGVGEGRLAYPGGTLTTHLGKGMGVPIGHPCGHVVTANSAQGVTALGHPGRRIMWAAGAEMGYPFDGIGGCGQGRLFLFYPADTLL